MRVLFKKTSINAKLPDYLTTGSVGADIYASLPGMGLSIAPGETKLVSTGLKVEIPEGYEIQIRSRSGLANAGVVVLNSPGTIDSDYRGEIKVMLHNFSNRGMMFNNGDRVAQMVLAKVSKIEWEEGDLESTVRNESGFGSTGSNSNP